jgi:hypothetical protein
MRGACRGLASIPIKSVRLELAGCAGGWPASAVVRRCCSDRGLQRCMKPALGAQAPQLRQSDWFFAEEVALMHHI